MDDDQNTTQKHAQMGGRMRMTKDQFHTDGSVEIQLNRKSESEKFT